CRWWSKLFGLSLWQWRNRGRKQYPKSNQSRSAANGGHTPSNVHAASPSEKQILAGIPGTLTNNYHRAEGQNCGNFLTVEEPKFLFEAKTVQRMELLVLSTLQWRMNPVTPISFFEHIVRRIGLKTLLHWEFLWRCQRVLLSVIPNSRYVGDLPSTLAAATMIHVIKEIEPLNAMEYINQLMGLLKTSEVC
ncbi:hypothetical protein S83_008591, partial [Arachis hypogaea]